MTKMITVANRCPFCGASSEVEVKASDLAVWEAGELAQNAFPYLTDGEREILITGICYECQDSIFT